MLRGAAGVVSLPSNKDKDSFNEVEVEEASHCCSFASFT
jgi:hypothetical protein